MGNTNYISTLSVGVLIGALHANVMLAQVRLICDVLLRYMRESLPDCGSGFNR